jgi:conjugal transfer ATP-binding protein TraC
MLSPKHLPREFSIALMNHMIGDPHGVHNQVRFPYFMSLTLHYPDQLEKKTAIEHKANWINHQLFGGSAAKFMINLGLKKEGFDILRQELETRSAVLVETTFTFCLFARRRDELMGHIEDIRTYWTSMGFEMRLDKNVLDVLLGQTLPLGASKLRSKGLERSHTLTSSQASQFLPILGEWRGTKNATMLLTTRRGEVAGFDLFDHGQSFSAVLVAAPGSGKSFVTQRMITDYLAEGAKVWVIDSGRSYQKLAAVAGGTFLEFSPNSDVCLNPFTDFLEERGGALRNINDEMDLLAALVERMAAQRDPLDDIGVEILKKAIRQTFIEHQGHSTIRNISDWLMAQVDEPRARDLAVRMDSFSYGQYAKFFNGHANVNMKNDFVVLELEGLSQQRQLQQVVLLQIIAQITNEMFNDNERKKILFIDEAWGLLDDPIMSRAMLAIFKKARKHRGSIVVVTQGISDLYNSPAGISMMESTAWQLILKQKTESIDAVRKNGQLTLDDYSFEMLKTLETTIGSHSEMMVVGNGCAGIFRLAVDKFTQAIFSTTGESRYQVLNDIAAGMDAMEAIERQIVGSEAAYMIETIRKLAKDAQSVGLDKSEVKRMIVDALS